jgi:hypothetical protein
MQPMNRVLYPAKLQMNWSPEQVVPQPPWEGRQAPPATARNCAIAFFLRRLSRATPARNPGLYGCGGRS